MRILVITGSLALVLAAFFQGFLWVRFIRLHFPSPTAAIAAPYLFKIKRILYRGIKTVTLAPP